MLVKNFFVKEMATLLRQQTELEKMISNGQVLLVEASTLSLDDKFMKYKPQTKQEKAFKKLISKAIKSELKDFYRPVCDPSFNDDMTGICYEFGKKPAVGKSYNWWANTAKEFMQNSRLGTRYEYVAFLGLLIKKLVESGWSISTSWRAVCTDSIELGNYLNSDYEKFSLEDTGSREVYGFYDLANTLKILAEDKKAGSFWVAGGCYGCNSYYSPLARLRHDDRRNIYFNYCVGWLVLNYCTDH